LSIDLQGVSRSSPRLRQDAKVAQNTPVSRMPGIMQSKCEIAMNLRYRPKQKRAATRPKAIATLPKL
jgi:hypothetical protein